jgi:hypothetical protein
MPFVSAEARGNGWALSSALDLGVLLAAYSVTSPHTIHQEANLPSLLAFASDLGVDVPEATARYFAVPDGDAASASDG